MAAFNPGASPPDVRIPNLFTVLAFMVSSIAESSVIEKDKCLAECKDLLKFVYFFAARIVDPLVHRAFCFFS